MPCEIFTWFCRLQYLFPFCKNRDMGDKEACEECKLKCSFIHGDKNGPSPSVTTFHKILTGDGDFSKHLCLPQTVSQTIPGLVAGKIYFLEDSNNQVWKVILFTKDGQLAFGKGWDKFFADHGLREGYTIAFHYMVSHFVVQIIDETGIEKLEFPIVNGYKRKRSEFDDSCNAVGECQKVSNTTTEKQENSLKLNSEENQTFNGNEAHEVSKAVKTEPVVLVIDDSETESNELLDVTKHKQENIQDASPYCIGQLNRIKRLKFECQNEPKDRKDLLRGSQFFHLLGVKNTKDCPAALVGCFCRIYDENNKKFVIKDGVSISFCANEVANALQIKNSGKLKEQIKLKGKEPGKFCINCFPSFVDDLKLKWGGEVRQREKKTKDDNEKIYGRTKRNLSLKSLVSILNDMELGTEESREQYKKLICFYVIDQVLLPSSEADFCRSSYFKYVNNLNVCEGINWAQETLDAIHRAALKVKAKQSKTFDACSSVFVAMILSRIPKLIPSGANISDTLVPADKYPGIRRSASRWNEHLSSLNSSDIQSCPFCD